MNPGAAPNPQMERIDFVGRMERELNMARLTQHLVPMSGYELFQCVCGLGALEQYFTVQNAPANVAEVQEIQRRLREQLPSALREAAEMNRRAAQLPALPPKG